MNIGANGISNIGISYMIDYLNKSTSLLSLDLCKYNINIYI